MLFRRLLWLLIAVLLVGATIFGVRAWQKRGFTPRFYPPIAPSVSVEEIHTNWSMRVKEIVTKYDQDQNALAARDALLLYKVAPQDQEIHLGLVLALQEAIEKKADAEAKWQAAKARLPQ